jgi:predicted RNase H-like HicB family nuclease
MLSSRWMKLYRLKYTVRPPGPEDEPDKFIAEVPSLPGCRAWGDTPAQALEILQSVAAAFIELAHERSEPLPAEIESAAVDMDGAAAGEVLVAV